METIATSDGYREYQSEAHKIIRDVIESAINKYEKLREAEHEKLAEQEKSPAAGEETELSGQESSSEKVLEQLQSVDGIPNIRWPSSKGFVMDTGLEAIQKFIEVITITMITTL